MPSMRAADISGGGSLLRLLRLAANAIIARFMDKRQKLIIEFSDTQDSGAGYGWLASLSF